MDQEVEMLVRRLNRLEEFLSNLTDMDKLNFQVLVNLPNAEEIIDYCPDGEYKEMAALAREILKVKEGSK